MSLPMPPIPTTLLTGTTTVLTLLLSAVHYLVMPLGYPLQLLLFVVAVAGLGVPHAALDHQLQRAAARRAGIRFEAGTLLGRYFGLVALYVLLWFWLPFLSVFLFLAVAAWHFGCTDRVYLGWDAESDGQPLLFGMLVLALLLGTHLREVMAIMAALFPSLPGTGMSFHHLAAILPDGPLYGSVLFLPLAGWLFRAPQRLRALQLLLLLLACSLLPLLPAFALYFSGWHALIALNETGPYTTGEQQQFSLFGLLKKALPITLLALLLASGLYLLHAKGFSSSHLAAPVLLLLSLIVLPQLGIQPGVHRQISSEA